MKNCYLLSILFFFITNSLCYAQAPLLWGYTLEGGQHNDGIILDYNVTTGIEADKHDFSGSPTDGQYPISVLTKANNGLLYGMTHGGGAHHLGTIFNYNINTGVETDLYSFGSGTDGIAPSGLLIQASDSLLYGMTQDGGTNGAGILFSYNIATGMETDIHDFGSGTDGQTPLGSLVQASNKLLYGLVGNGGVYNDGIIFSYDISNGSYIDVHDFGNNTDGQVPEGSLIQVDDSLLYGMTSEGGVDSFGIIFNYNVSNGNYADIHDFGSGIDGKNPWYGNLLLVSDSLLYGMTEYGGLNKAGIIFNYNISTNTETNIHNFGISTDGKNPEGSLIQCSDGLLYGMTSAGGTKAYGTIFNYNITTGTETDIHDFGNGTDGMAPLGSLIEVDTIGATPITSSICSGYSITLKASGATTYTWSPATGLSASTGDSVIATPTATTTYTVIGIIGTAGTSYAQTDSTTVTVTVIPNPTIKVTTPSPICNGGSATLIANGATTYTWSPSTGLNATTGDSVIASPAATTIYTLTGDSLGCKTAITDTVKVITASPLPIVPPSAFLCYGQSDTLFAQGAGNNFTWSPSSGLSATIGSSVIATPSVTTTYTVTGPDSLGCTATGTVVVTIFPSPNPPTFTQKGDTLISSSQYDNQWYYNGAPLNNDTSQRLIITVPGYYWVVVNNEANGCSTASDSMKVDTVSGIEQLTVESGQLTIYPNPTTGEINIVSTKNISEVTVTNLLGQTVLKSPLGDLGVTHFTFELKTEGMYFVTVNSDNETETKRVVVTK